MNNYRLFELMEELNNAKEYAQIQNTVNTFCHECGFDHFIYGARIPTSIVSPTYFILSGYPPEWRDHYIEQNYIQIDPTVLHCFTNLTPIYWENISKSNSEENKQVYQLFSEAHEHGLRNGISFPIHSIHGETAMFSFSTGDTPDKSRLRIKQNQPISQLFVNYVHEAISRIPKSGLQARLHSELTEREKECLLWTTDGKTSWEVSQILNISERTVAFHLNNTIKKLNVTNKQHAVARAISLGYIKPVF